MTVRIDRELEGVFDADPNVAFTYLVLIKDLAWDHILKMAEVRGTLASPSHGAFTVERIIRAMYNERCRRVQ